MEHRAAEQPHKPQWHLPNRWPHAQTPDSSDFDDEHREGNMQDLRQPCPPQTTTECLSSSPPGLAPPQLRLQNNQATNSRAPRTRREDPTTKAQAATQAPLDAIIVAKQKSAPLKQPPQQTTRRRCRQPPRQRCRQPLVSSCSRLRDDAPKEEEDVKAPSSRDPADLRFSSGAKAAGRGERQHTAATCPRKIAAPAGVAAVASGKGRR